VTLTIVAGASYLELPVRLPREDDARLPEFGEPEGSEPLQHETLAEAPQHPGLSVNRDGDRTELRTEQAHAYRLRDGLEYHGLVVNTFSIDDGDPLSAIANSEDTITVARGTWRTDVHARSELTCDATTFFVKAALAALDDDEPLFDREWTFEIPRDHV
jgi:hypothetical protein